MRSVDVRGQSRARRRGGGDRGRCTSGCSRRRARSRRPGTSAAPPSPCARRSTPTTPASSSPRTRERRTLRRLLHRLPGPALGPLRLPRLGRGPRGRPGAPLAGDRQGAARRRHATGRASAAPPTSSSTRPRRAPTPTASTSARAPTTARSASAGSSERSIGSRAMPGRIVLFGATGYTGRLTADALVARGDRPVLAGAHARDGSRRWPPSSAGSRPRSPTSPTPPRSGRCSSRAT